jgi:soluble lytic murein transglycosylase-like protein
MGKRTKFGAVLLLSWLAAAASATDVATLRNGFTIRHERRVQVGATTRLYLSATDQTSYVDIPTAEIDRIEQDLTPVADPPMALTPTAPQPTVAPAPAATAPASGLNLSEVVSEASGRYRLDPDLVNSVIRAESGFNPHAVSPKGAQGLMQLMPGTASKLGVPNAFDPAANVDGGTRYLRELLELYNYDLIKALAAYNAGTKRVEQYRGVPPYRETRAYVASIVRDFNRKKIAQQKAAKTGTAAQPPQPRAQTQSRNKTVQAQVKPQTKTAPSGTTSAAKRSAPPTGN